MNEKGYFYFLNITCSYLCKLVSFFFKWSNFSHRLSVSSKASQCLRNWRWPIDSGLALSALSFSFIESFYFILAAPLLMGQHRFDRSSEGSQQAHDVIMTSYQRRCDVDVDMTSL